MTMACGKVTNKTLVLKGMLPNKAMNLAKRCQESHFAGYCQRSADNIVDEIVYAAYPQGG
jgi:hypothetical protein